MRYNIGDKVVLLDGRKYTIMGIEKEYYHRLDLIKEKYVTYEGYTHRGSLTLKKVFSENDIDHDKTSELDKEENFKYKVGQEVYLNTGEACTIITVIENSESPYHVLDSKGFRQVSEDDIDHNKTMGIEKNINSQRESLERDIKSLKNIITEVKDGAIYSEKIIINEAYPSNPNLGEYSSVYRFIEVTLELVEELEELMDTEKYNL